MKSVNMGFGQFCTSPGLAIGITSGEFDRFAEQLRSQFARTNSGVMLTPGIASAYCDAIAQIGNIEWNSRDSGRRKRSGAGTF